MRSTLDTRLPRRIAATVGSVLLPLLLSACTSAQDGRAKVHTDIGGRHAQTLTHWDFLKDARTNDPAAAMAATGWTRVTLPHTWNNRDGEDGGNNYAKIPCWYRTPLTATPDMLARRVILRFAGANRQAELFVNGASVGTHVGGFGAFAFDITTRLHPGKNELAVRVSNEPDKNSPPLSADFTFFGGIYRRVDLLVLDPLHISPLDDASSGVRVLTSDITDASAKIAVGSLIANDSAAPVPALVAVDVRDAEGNTVAHSEAPAVAIPGRDTLVQSALTLNNPHLWNGRKDPYLYSVRVQVKRGGVVTDEVTQPLGIRTFAIDKEKGFLLNGQPYHLHGVNMHQDWIDEGWAISDKQLDEDMAFVKEIGATAIRLAHYQHHPHFYDLCDKAGIVVWTEVPVVNSITADEAFTKNAEQQERELIRQNWNHPSICFWSMGNEVGTGGGNPTKLFTDMNRIAHQEDPTRMTTLAFAGKGREWPGITDTWGKNRYFGWYSGSFDDLPRFLAGEGSEAMSEYGAGASIYFHSEYPVRMDHTEEYQCLFHEVYWPALKAKPSIWGTYVWVLFDFSADQRREGDHAGRNDKGLVTYDRKTRKDAFYYYKANWSDEPVVHLNSKRFTVRGLDHIPIKVYANTPEVELVVNGKSLGTKSGQNCVFLWDGVPLKEGANHVIARGERNGKKIEDTCTWTYKPGAPTEVYIPQDETMREALKKGPPRAPAPKPPAAKP
ncbi:MAG: glycoside hydrolase family 2 protein [Phycisphaerae bacterium]